LNPWIVPSNGWRSQADPDSATPRNRYGAQPHDGDTFSSVVGGSIPSVAIPGDPPSKERRRPSMTLASSIPLLKGRPRLGHLEVSLIAKPIDPIVLSGISSSTVYRISFPFPAIESPWEVYQCMAVMFPKIRFFGGFSYRRNGRNDTGCGI